MREKWLGLYLCGLTLLLAAKALYDTRFQPVQVAGLAIEVSPSGASAVEVAAILANAEREVKRVLPRSYLYSVILHGECATLPQLAGTLILDFQQVPPRLGRPRVWMGTVFVDTADGTMGLRTQDDSPYYPAIARLDWDEGLPIGEIAAIAQKQIVSLGIAECDVLLWRSGRGGEWTVECTRSGSGRLGERQCAFSVDARTGRVMNE
jgi:hypothetical protein